ncbi:MAG: 3-deoxy-7-phosphoheptulonate synthase, partial [Selenomonadales bacterium]|nr:3-deoxy-7-phosphoheptulonate synthase [Selenomonadales bacterium]
MIIVMEPKATQEQVEAVKDRLVQAGFQTHLSVGESRTIIGVIGDKKEMSKVELEVLSGVEKCVSITEDYKLVNREFKPEDTIIDVGGAKIGGNHLAVMA